ncbi:hypothetical protein BDF20DRAFT_838425 [Mycotypha africana]|uniref:uncharacterized protein n=1 Tax=Mycotypha africana TaxID=64632 RepID=UPI002301AFAB|nr:uncharacterized protein BDF20DRAFT_838425 [Mycotypha africana]KAI8970022.1 hypothetical protein BDF20DRAFT_838425 [Mycotypha africana]
MILFSDQTKQYLLRHLRLFLSDKILLTLKNLAELHCPQTREIVISCTFFAIIYSRSLHVVYFTICAILATVVAKILKSIIRQPRPIPKLLKHNGKVIKAKVKKSYGMPSSHSTAISFFAAYIHCLIIYELHRNKTATLSSRASEYCALTLFHCFACGVIWSRVRLEHHTRAQVIAGTLLGMSLAILSYILWKDLFAAKLENVHFANWF